MRFREIREIREIKQPKKEKKEEELGYLKIKPETNITTEECDAFWKQIFAVKDEEKW